MTWIERKVLALIEFVRSNKTFDAQEAKALADDALDSVATLSKNRHDVLLNVCGDLLSVFPAIERHLTGEFKTTFALYKEELLALKVQADRLKREGSYQ